MATKKTAVSTETKSVLMRPRITEKTTMQSIGRIYTFDVTPNANKTQVFDAIVATYKVTPVKVNVINVKPTRVFVRGRKGTTSGLRKAIVHLKKGDKIELA